MEVRTAEARGSSGCRRSCGLVPFLGECKDDYQKDWEVENY